MINYLENLNPTILAFIATMITYTFTIAGSALVFPFKNVKRSIMDGMLGMASGLMIAASFFSLLLPAIENAEILNQKAWLVVTLGFLLGGLLLFITDKISSKILDKKQDASVKKRTFMMLFSITIHNIPEDCIKHVSQEI